MKGFFIQDLKRSFFNRGFLVGVGGLTAMFLYTAVIWSGLNGSQDSYFILVDAWAISGFIPMLPVFPVLAYASRFCEEYGSGYYRMIFARMRPEKFALMRMTSAGLSGGCAVAIPILILCLAADWFGVSEITDPNALRVPGDLKMVVISMKYGYSALVFLKVLLGFLFGATWAMVGLAFGVWFLNKYVSLIGPFVLYEALWILCDGKLRILSPTQLVRGDDVNYGAGYGLPLAMECVWLMVTAAIVLLSFRKRFVNE